MSSNTPPSHNAKPAINPPRRIRRKQVAPIAPSEGRRSRRQNAFRKVDVERALSAAAKAGFVAGGLEVAPDGTIRILVAKDNGSSTLFEQWQDRL